MPLSARGGAPFFLCHKRIRLRATSHASSFDITSHRPSLARMRHSSSLARGMNISSGSGMIHGFKYRSPVNIEMCKINDLADMCKDERIIML